MASIVAGSLAAAQVRSLTAGPLLHVIIKDFDYMIIVAKLSHDNNIITTSVETGKRKWQQSSPTLTCLLCVYSLFWQINHTQNKSADECVTRSTINFSFTSEKLTRTVKQKMHKAESSLDYCHYIIICKLTLTQYQYFTF